MGIGPWWHVACADVEKITAHYTSDILPSTPFVMALVSGMNGRNFAKNLTLRGKTFGTYIDRYASYDSQPDVTARTATIIEGSEERTIHTNYDPLPPPHTVCTVLS